MTILIGMLYWTAIAADKEAQVPDIASVEKQVLSYRRSIQRGHVVFIRKTYENKIYKPRFDRIITVWFDGKKIRNDDLFRYSDEPGEAPLHREVTCRNCEKEGYWVDYIDKKIPGAEIAVSMSNMARKNDPELFGIIHPRILGMVLETLPNLATSRAHLESVIGRPDRENVRIQSSRFQGQECRQITYMLNNWIVRVWISPHQGPSILRIESETDFPGKHIADSLDSDLHKFNPSGLWYPKSAVYERRINGESVTKEVTEVQVISLNEPVAPETFTLAGMNISVDTPVAISGKSGESGVMKNWNGKELVTKYLPSPKVSAPDPKIRTFRSKTQRWLLIANAVFFALLAIFLFWRRRRRTQST